MFSVVRGNPDEAELAALAIAISAKLTSQAAERPKKPSTWATYRSPHRLQLAPGAGAWRASTLIQH
jgi:hypothetical protein